MSTSIKPVAEVPYAYERSLSFYPEYVQDGETKVYYDELTVVQLTNKSFTQFLLLIPLFKIRTVGLHLGARGAPNALPFKQSTTSAFAFPTARMKDLDIIYKEILTYTIQLLLPVLTKTLLRNIKNGEAVKFSGLTVTRNSIVAKRSFGRTQELDEYGGCKIQKTGVYVFDGRGRVFYSLSLFDDNALALPAILDTLFRD